MKAYVTIAAIGLFFATSLAKTPTTQPPSAASKPAATDDPVVDPEIRKVLDAMEAAGDNVKTIRADVRYQVLNMREGLKELRTGWVAYQSKETVKSGDKKVAKPTMFRVHFDTMRLGRGKTVSRPVDYAYDGKNLTVARAKNKTITRFQLPPNQGNQALKLGKGPMPLPFGQKTPDMIKYFTCTTRPKRIADKGAIFLKLVPRKAHAKTLDTVEIQMWVSEDDYLPVKIITRDKSKNKTTCWFSKMTINKPVKPSIFRFPKPLGWKLIVQPFKEGQNIKP